MYRWDKRLDVKLRLGEIDRRLAELTAVSSRLAHMAEQLARARKVNERICLLIDRRRPSSRRRSRVYYSRNCDRSARCSSRAGVEH